MRLEHRIPVPDRSSDAEDSAGSDRSVPPVVSYESRLNADPRWALGEGSLFFEDKGAVQNALRRITTRLRDLNIPYSVVDGMALFHHGYRQFTEDVDLLVSREGLKLIHEKLDGLGYVPPFARSKNLRDVESGVKIEFLVSGEYPGDGKPKPVAFPEPMAASYEDGGIRYLKLNSLVELKLASGMTSPNRAKDLADILELIKAINLPLDFATNLNPYVQEKFQELWQAARRRFVRLCKNPFHAASLDELIAKSGAEADELAAMRTDGVIFERNPSDGQDWARLITADPQIAQKYGMEDESEFMS